MYICHPKLYVHVMNKLCVSKCTLSTFIGRKEYLFLLNVYSNYIELYIYWKLCLIEYYLFTSWINHINKCTSSTFIDKNKSFFHSLSSNYIYWLWCFLINFYPPILFVKLINKLYKQILDVDDFLNKINKWMTNV